MSSILNYPLLVLAFSLVAFYLSGWIGASFRKKRSNLGKDEWEDFNLIMTGTLTLLGLIIGFTFSMAISRYDQRKNYEEAEANAIGTEYLRLDLLPAADATKARALLLNYLDKRILFYETRDDRRLQQIDAATARLQTDLWSAVQAPAERQPTPVVALTVSGMNDVLNSQGYTQAAWWNRIPTAAWDLMVVIAIFCNVLIGYGMHRTEAKNAMLLVLPIVVSISFFLISDIDSPRGGTIRVNPQNLTSLSQSLRASD
jgi:hypothetical protein